MVMEINKILTLFLGASTKNGTQYGLILGYFCRVG